MLQGPGDLVGRLTSALDRLGFTPSETVVHVHNHALGKNRLVPLAASRLAERGFALLLQIHDFAEDFRPDNFRRMVNAPANPAGHGGLYPQAANIHYAVLNGRDHEILAAAGVHASRLHLLPNPVPELNDLPSRSAARQRLAELFAVGPDECFVLYPVRCIRRKNVGEALLYAALALPCTTVGLTLAPLNPAAVPIYSEWKELAAELALPCRFEVGGPGALSFTENLAAADAILTTSLTEGFGMVFLESWLAGRPLLGRDLPEITSDFVRSGLRFDWLYHRLRVPLEWIGAEPFRQRVDQAYEQTLAAYDRPVPDRANEGLADEGLEAKTADGLVDFGDLDEPFQRTVLRAVRQDERDRRRVLGANPWIEATMAVRAESAAGVIDENVRAINRSYSLPASGRRLCDLLRKVSDGERDGRPRPLAHPGRILDRFLAPRRFRLIHG